MEFYIFDLNLNRHGILDDFIDVKINPKYDDLGSLHLTVEGTKNILDLLQVDRIIVKTTDLTKGYIIKTFEYLDEKATQLQIIAPSLNVILNDRLVLGQQEFNGYIENVMKSFVYANAVAPANPNRIIPNLTISSSVGIPIETTEGTVNQPLCDYLYELAKKHDVSFDILLDHENKKLVFHVWQGIDRSSQQSENPRVIFAKEFENVLRQHYVESVTDNKTTAIVLGEEIEGSPQEIVTVNDELSGFNRKEILVEGNDIKKTFTNENDQEITLSDAEYRRLLDEKGRNTLSEYIPIRTFESDIDPGANFIYETDYFLGDKVSIRNDELGVILHTRIVGVIETENKQGYSLQLNFGSNIPSLIDKVKRAVNN
ncbi:siphovirus ReqiPepy6 Gp37-like family protein [Robertmurraya sp. FSL W8-0741]|uniref:siphovirus ReqiPepy6 Gp37-like family protein n=1 Tax=Robertmurraya sp. FSL W8-0741 TaxID=2954629 RepID=UPI0030F742C2